MTRFRLLSPLALGGALLAFTACNPKSEDSAQTEAVAPAEPMTEMAPVADLSAPLPETASATAAPSFETLDERVSYTIGFNIGRQIGADDSIDVNVDALSLGIRESVEGVEPRISEEQMRADFAQMREKAEQAAQANSGTQIAAAEAFLSDNAARPEVTVTDSGLQYEVLVEGDGASPTADDTVEVHYHGTLIDGTVFDSSVDRGQTIEFPVTGVIPGWIEALQLMQVGDKWKLYIPYDLAYGPQGSGPIPPFSTLIFEVELVSIK